MVLLLNILGLILGIVSGIFTGLIPGIHINVIASLAVAAYSSFSEHPNLSLPLATFIASLSIAHGFFDYIPSLFLGIPTDEVYALLPGQQLVKKGQGGEALRLSAEGTGRSLLFAFIIAIFLLLVNIVFGFNILSIAESAVKPFLFWILLIISFFLIFDEKNRTWALIIFSLSGLFGVIVLGTPLVSGGTAATFGVLFPALSGLFGLSGLILSLNDDSETMPNQRSNISLHLSSQQVNFPALLGTISGMIVGLLPGLGSANAATFVLFFTGNSKTEDNAKSYIVTTSAIQTSDTLFGITALYFIEKSRSGASVAIEALLGSLSAWDTFLIICGMGVAGVISRYILLKSWKLFLKAISFCNYKALNLSVITFIVLLVILSTGLWGGVILVAATMLGLLPPITGIRRSQMMGFFLVPVMLFFSGFQASFVTLFGLEAQLSPPIPVHFSTIFINLSLCFIAALCIYFLTTTFKKS